MKTNARSLVLMVASGVLFMAGNANAVEKIYTRTPVGEVIVRTLPATRVMRTELTGSYFDLSGSLFRNLFAYIKGHGVPMTAPVEGSINGTPAMVFYVSDALRDRDLPDAGPVRVEQMPARTVAAVGARGSYREKNVRKYLLVLERWLAENRRYEAAGPPYAAYWHPPYIPWFLRRFEVHIPVRDRGAAPVDRSGTGSGATMQATRKEP